MKFNAFGGRLNFWTLSASEDGEIYQDFQLILSEKYRGLT
jgi:hypothetical protein